MHCETCWTVQPASFAISVKATPWRISSALISLLFMATIPVTDGLEINREPDSKVTPDDCQVKNKALPDAQDVFVRILKTLGAKNAPEAARILGLAKQSVYDWQKSIPSIESLLRITESGNTSLHWLLTGMGERYVGPQPNISLDAYLELKIREVVREAVPDIVRTELAAGTERIQDLGLVDFDLEAAVKKYDDPLPVLIDWYAHDDLAPGNVLATFAPSGWAEMSLEQKVKEIKAARGIMDRQRHRQDVSPKRTD